MSQEIAYEELPHQRPLLDEAKPFFLLLFFFLNFFNVFLSFCEGERDDGGGDDDIGDEDVALLSMMA